MVTADFDDANSYLVIWQQFDDLSNLDSVNVYSRLETEANFSKIGAVKITETGPTYYKDVTASTIAPTVYAITLLDSSGIESALSPWHQPAILDYTGNGFVRWTRYKIENQISTSFIIGYDLKTDPSGLNLWSTVASYQPFDSTGSDFTYTGFPQPQMSYCLFTQLPSCDFQTKANINRSRSNIKQQFSNASASLGEISNINNLMHVTQNPVSDELKLEFTFENSLTDIIITSNNGKQLINQKINGKSVSIDVSQLASGIYFVSTIIDGNTLNKRFIKK